MMPLTIRRSSTRGTPCDSGKCGSIRRICASDNQITKNLVLGNRGAAPYGGGIVLVSSDGADGAPVVAPSGNTVRKNVAFRNQPFDISWDGTGSGVVFRGNRCATSQPGDLCN